jgi:putative hydrolase of the HAD superfamily
MPWSAVVFDLDDTLYPERQYVLGGFRAVAAWAHSQFGFPEARSFEELNQIFEQGIRGTIFDRWLARHGCDNAAFLPVMVRVYREHQPQIAPFAGVRELLERLRRDFRLGLVTDGG